MRGVRQSPGNRCAGQLRQYPKAAAAVLPLSRSMPDPHLPLTRMIASRPHVVQPASCDKGASTPLVTHERGNAIACS